MTAIEILIILAAVILTVATAWIVLAAIFAPYMCDRCGRVLQTPLCPECDADIIEMMKGGDDDI